MSTTENKKKLLSTKPLALIGLHRIFGYDFQKPHAVLFLAGNYTAKKLEKLAAEAGYSADAETVILTRDKSGRCWNDDFRVAELNNGAFKIDFDKKTRCFSVKGHYKSPFDSFYTKGDFEETRKAGTAETFLICQEREYIRIPEEKKVDFSERFKVLNVRKCGDGKGAHWISGLELQQTMNNGNRVEYGGRWHFDDVRPGQDPTNLDDVIDKSGYLLRERRASLRSQAKQLRAERVKAAYDATNNAAQVEELRGLIEERKKEIVLQLQQATTAAEIKAVETALSSWRGLGGILSDFERFQRNTENKKYSSIEESNRTYTGIKNALQEGREDV